MLVSNMITKKGLAKEWLIFTGCIGFALLVGFCVMTFSGALQKATAEENIKDLLSGTSFIAVGLWLILALVRSIIWAIRTVRSK